MRTQLFWIMGPRQGRLAIMPRPRGGDWLQEEISAWRRAGVDVVVSLLTSNEAAELDLADEAEICRENDIDFLTFPIVDRDVPASMEVFADLLAVLFGQLTDGRSIVIHCRQGIGRAGLVAIGLLKLGGVDYEEAVSRVSLVRGCGVPETVEQRRWLAEFAKSLVA